MVHLSLPRSDHFPILFHSRRLDSNPLSGQAKPFRFEAHWISKSDCEDAIKSNWDGRSDPEVFGRIFEGIAACEMGLRMWLSDVVNNPEKRIKQLKERNAYLHKQNQTTACLEERRKLQVELEQVYTDEDKY